MKRRLIASLVGALMALTLGALAALAGGTGGGTDGKCNSGRGNMSETAPATDCDPGDSGANNQGGD